ncbi:hypothetical protein BHE74_00002340 [Ensete ventricosum]|nr:hypothetical protein BHE74_00002340 [Ensete ventricosum]
MKGVDIEDGTRSEDSLDRDNCASILAKYDRSGRRVGLIQCSHSLKGARRGALNKFIQLLNSSSGEQLGAKRHVAAEQKIEDSTKGEEIQPLIAIVLASMAVPSKAEVLSLLRSLLKTARKFGDYNIREYARRRAVDGFRENTKLSDPSAIATAFAEGTSQLEVAKRQASVYTLYAPSVKSVMEVRSL